MVNIKSQVERGQALKEILGGTMTVSSEAWAWSEDIYDNHCYGHILLVYVVYLDPEVLVK